MLSALRRFIVRTGRGALPPLPQHAKRGLRIEKGDSVEATQFTVSLVDARKRDELTQPYIIRIPPWHVDHKCGATFGLSSRLEPFSGVVDGNRVDVSTDGWSIEVALKEETTDIVARCYSIAEKMLDIVAVESFRVVTLAEPLGEHGLWFRKGSKCVLRTVTTIRSAIEVKSAFVVKDSTGAIRQQSAPAINWHASYAYFRRSQATDDLHDAYRNIFLALESLLSEVYPWKLGMGEIAWLEAALEHVITGYNLDLRRFVGGTGNPYKRFTKKQYRATRCALFHAKVSAQPVLPGELTEREELIDATRTLAQLYVELARKIVGGRFGGSSTSRSVFDKAVDIESQQDLYVSATKEFDPATVFRAKPKVTRLPTARAAYQLTAQWLTPELPALLRRAGLILNGEDGASAEVAIETADSHVIEFVLQHELANANALREWYV